MYPDFKELLSVLNEHQAKYLIVGAYALSIHAQPRATKDLDIFIKADPENAKAVFTALAKFGAPLDDFIATKIASGRPQDVADVAAVREADKQRAVDEVGSGG